MMQCIDQMASHNVLWTMNGWMAIPGSFYVDIKDRRVLALSAVYNNMRDVSVRVSNITRSVLDWSDMLIVMRESSSALCHSSNGEIVASVADGGYMGKCLLDLRKRISSMKEYREGNVALCMTAPVIHYMPIPYSI